MCFMILFSKSYIISFLCLFFFIFVFFRVLSPFALSPSLYSPVNNKPCVHYDVKVEEWRKRGDDHHWVTVCTEQRTVDFFLVDDTGGSVFVQGATVTPFTMDQKSKTGGGFWGGTSATPGLEALMQRHGRSAHGFFGGNKKLRISEGSFEIGEVLACL